MSTQILAITHPLSEQEVSGIVTTSLSRAYHALLGNTPDIRFTTTNAMLTESVPNKAVYSASCLSIANGQGISVSAFITKLVTMGYIRHATSIQDEGFFVRGDEVRIRHPIISDFIQISFLGNQIEKIVLEEDRRTKIIQHCTIPPIIFPQETQPLNEILSLYTLIDPPSAPARKTYSSSIGVERAMELIGRLTPGKPAVHADHGIGIFEGLEQRSVGGIQAEYIILRYAGGDSISVPVPFAHKVSPYIGESAPAVYKLGGTLWSKTKRKAKEDAALFAKELIDITKQRSNAKRPAYRIDTTTEEILSTTFGYELTPDQATAWQEVQQDLTGKIPMDRLVVGDVGFGKTELAIRAARHVFENGKQVAILAPTTLLVQQHFDTFKNRLPEIASSIFLLSRFTPTQEIQKAKQALAEGKPAIIIGTHAILSGTIPWKSLALLVIDEEQRFGVKQKEHLKKFRASIDILSLSATPIPRTLSMALSGLRSLSVIATAPEGRKDIATVVQKETDIVLTDAITKELERKGQVYIVAPKIRSLGMIEEIVRKLVPSARTAIAHAQLSDEHLSEIIHNFDTGKIDILVSSSIVENGLDLPNVNSMIVWNAPHFGLAQLYQLRGRIGRRSRQGYAYFLYSQEKLTPIQRQRLSALTDACRLGSGWDIARHDLEMRGAGNLLGKQQSGSPHEVGMQLYLDMVDGRSEAEDTRADIHIVLPAYIPPAYIPDTNERTSWYVRLSRSQTIQELYQKRDALQDSYGELPQEVQDLLSTIALEIAATHAGITNITTKTVAPSDEDPYVKIECTAKDPLQTLKKLSNIKNDNGSPSNWTVRDHTLSWSTDTVTPDLVAALTSLLQ